MVNGFHTETTLSDKRKTREKAEKRQNPVGANREPYTIIPTFLHVRLPEARSGCFPTVFSGIPLCFGIYIGYLYPYVIFIFCFPILRYYLTNIRPAALQFARIYWECVSKSPSAKRVCGTPPEHCDVAAHLTCGNPADTIACARVPRAQAGGES